MDSHALKDDFILHKAINSEEKYQKTKIFLLRQALSRGNMKKI